MYYDHLAAFNSIRTNWGTSTAIAPDVRAIKKGGLLGAALIVHLFVFGSYSDCSDQIQQQFFGL